MLQERINELDSAIINIKGNLVYTIGFYNTNMLNLFLNEGKKNWSSTGRYDFEEITFHNIKTDATFILQKDDIEIAQYRYKVVKTGTLVYENEQNKSGKATSIYEIRKELYSTTWNLRIADSSLVFETWEDMRNYILTEYQSDIGEVILDEESVNS